VSRRRHPGRTLAQAGWLVTGVLLIAVLAIGQDVLRHGLGQLLAGVAIGAGAYGLGRRHGGRRGPGPKAASRSLEDSQRLRQAAELEQLANRPLDAICDSYRVIARRHGGRP
jgi:hypothetical protein